MGALIEGQWRSDDEWRRVKGAFVRENAQFRSWLNDDDRFPFEPGRYHLYVSYACPWAHRTLIVRELMGLAPAIGVSVVEPLMLKNGWEFSTRRPDSINDCSFAYQLYQLAKGDYSGRVTVPILWDREAKVIVNNESSEIIRMFNRLPQDASRAMNLYPTALQAQIDSVNDRVYGSVNNGVYRAGFATTQGAYVDAVNRLFETLDWLDETLTHRSYLVGDTLTEADIRLFVTLIRFDAVYVSHFKCSRRRIVDYPSLWSYVRRLYAIPAFQKTTRLDEIKEHYYGSHPTINPTGIIPVGPDLSWVAQS